MYVVCLMAKNEAATLAQTLDSACAVLGNGDLRAIVVQDTGSTDGTQQIAERGGATVYEAEWVDFATNRNQLLVAAEQFANAGDVVLMLDAGTILRGDGFCSEIQKHNAWNVTVRLGALDYQRVQVFKPGAGWKYAGKVHEAPAGPGTVGATDLIVDYCLKDDARPERWHRDLALLEDDYTPRARFYYAQTLELIGRRAEAYFWYLHRGARADGWYEERAMAYIRAIQLAPSEAAAQWCAAKALEIDGTRGEAWLQLGLYRASCAASPQEWAVVGLCADEALVHVPKPGALFIDTTREYLARELSARATFWRGDKDLARELWTNLLPVAPEWARTALIENLKFCEE